MRLFTGGISTETNSFSPLPTGLSAFRIGDADNTLVRHAAEESKARGWTHIRGMVAEAHPGAVTPRAVYEELRERLIADVSAALPLDIVLVDVHGGMVADGYDDPEGDLFERIRSVCGPTMVIGARLDPHSHLSPAMLAGADLLCFYKENPHIDMAARAKDLLRLAVDTAQGRIRPVMSSFDCRMSDVFQTNREPMKSFVGRLREMEGKDSILDISVVHGFRRADVPIMGTHVIVITDNQPEAGARIAESLGHELFAMRGNAAAPYVPLAEAVERVAGLAGPTILADLADNPGGGSPGDGTCILKALFDRGITNVAIGYMVDPLALDFARQAGVGATLPLRIGGKACKLSGEPIDLLVTVRAIWEQGRLDSVNVDMGPCAWVSAKETDIVLIGVRLQTYTPELFERLGVDLSSKQVIVVKSAQHYRAWFGQLTEGDIVVDAPGVCTADWRNLPFQRVRRDIWPFTEQPWGA